MSISTASQSLKPSFDSLGTALLAHTWIAAVAQLMVGAAWFLLLLASVLLLAAGVVLSFRLMLAARVLEFSYDVVLDESGKPSVRFHTVSAELSQQMKRMQEQIEDLAEAQIAAAQKEEVP